jgi:hypothetical protein
MPGPGYRIHMTFAMTFAAKTAAIGLYEDDPVRLADRAPRSVDDHAVTEPRTDAASLAIPRE